MIDYFSDREYGPVVSPVFRRDYSDGGLWCTQKDCA